MSETTLLEEIGSLLYHAIEQAQAKRADALKGMLFEWSQIHQDAIWKHLEEMKTKARDINIAAEQWASGVVK